MTQESDRILPIVNFDPFSRFLQTKLHLTPLLFGLLILGLNILVDGFIGLQYGIFIKKDFPTQISSLVMIVTPPAPGILQDFMALVTDGIYMPILCGLYLWAPLGSTQVFQRLANDGVFKSNERFQRLVDSYRKVYASKLPFAIILGFSLSMGILQLGAYFNWFAWKTVGGYIDKVAEASFYRFPFWVILFYTLAFAAFNVGVTIFILRKSFNPADIHIIPFHPDKCGGLGGISKYTTAIGLGISMIGLVLSAATVYEVMFGALAKAVPVIIGIAAYLALGPLFFFLPLGTAHNSMKKAKEEELLGIAHRFTHLYRKLKEDTLSPDEYNEKLSNLDNIKKLYEVANAFPVWPFDVKSLSRFLTIIATPLIPAFVAVVQVLVEDFLQ